MIPATLIKTPGYCIFYLCHPYTADKEAAFRFAAYSAEWALAKGYVLFSPVMHTHHFEELARYKHDPEIFYQWDLQLLEGLDPRRVALLVDGRWQESKGCRREVAFAQKNDIPCLDFEEFCLGHDVVEIERLPEMEIAAAKPRRRIVP